jgi:hypothetical protein
MGGTDETLSGDLRVARGYGVRSATASAARRDQPAAASAGSAAAAEVTLFKPQFAGWTAGFLPNTRRRDAVEALAQ